MPESYSPEKLEKLFKESCVILKKRIKNFSDLSVTTSTNDTLAMLVMLESLIAVKRSLDAEDN